MSPTHRMDRTSRRRLRALWKPEYDTLARFNGERHRGIAHDPAFIERMAEIQRDYDEHYLPASRALDRTAKWHRVWL